MLIILFVLMIAGYTFLELYYRSQKIQVTWRDRILGGIGGVILVFSAQYILDQRGEELETLGSYVFVILTVVPAAVLMAVAWLAITKRQ